MEAKPLTGFKPQTPPKSAKPKQRAASENRKKSYRPLNELNASEYSVTVYAKAIMSFEMTTVHAFPPKEVLEKRITECISQSVFVHKLATKDSEYQGIVLISIFYLNHLLILSLVYIQNHDIRSLVSQTILRNNFITVFLGFRNELELP
jgi:hypothetical protein